METDVDYYSLLILFCGLNAVYWGHRASVIDTEDRLVG
jgi:hypothetical protein